MAASSSSEKAIRVTIKPTPGFCIKTKTIQDCLYKPSNPPSLTSPLSITNQDGRVSFPEGLKVFINVAWDSNVPPPPDATEEVIESVIAGSEEGWFVPIIVSEGRLDVDKG